MDAVPVMESTINELELLQNKLGKALLNVFSKPCSAHQAGMEASQVKDCPIHVGLLQEMK